MPYGVYVHLPWCRTRCHYCSFNVHVSSTHPQRAYTDALLARWEACRELLPGPPATLYFGGGTPSLHPPEELRRLIEAIGADFVELEANPEDLDLAPRWREAGVRRLSVGVQSFDARQIRFLNRLHRAAELGRRIRAFGPLFDSWSVDLIFGLPGQTLRDLEGDLSRLLDTDPPHVSLYGLTAHPGTAFARSVDRGRFRLDDEQQADMLEHIVGRLDQAGRHRYEVSNFARPGHRSPHNELVWRGHPYVGLGAGAHGWLPDGRRTVAPADPTQFIEGRAWEEEIPTPHQQAIDLIITMMRHVDGVPLERLRSLGFDLKLPSLRPHVERGGLRLGDSVSVAGPGWMHADGLVFAVVEALTPMPPALT